MYRTGQAGQSLSDAGSIPRASLIAETFSDKLKLDNFRVSSSGAILGAAAAGIIGLVMGAVGTASPLLESEVANANSKTDVARYQYTLPENYVAGAAITVIVSALKTGTLQVNGTVDIQVFKKAGDGTVGADICTTAQQNVTTSLANYSFTITPTGLVAGDELDIQLTLIANDTGGANSKKVQCPLVTVQYSIKG